MNKLETRIPAPIVALLLGLGMKAYAFAAQIPLDNTPALAEWGIRMAQLSALIALLAFASFSLARTSINPIDPSRASRLITGGIFRFSRNPLYLSLLLLLVAYAMRLNNWVAWLGPLIFVAYVTRFQIIPEERILTGKFGTPYQDYLQRTRRWL